MMGSWWFLWMIVMFMFLVPPIGYGWGYRGWGPPYPSYVQRRRGQRAAAAGGSATFNHESWGWGGDLMWLVAVIGIFWVLSAFWWRT
jgi:hypothetical protein